MLYLPCPKCNGELQLRIAKRGSNSGTKFYGCDNFPQCKFTVDKENVHKTVKNDIFKGKIPSPDSKSWNYKVLNSLTLKALKYLASVNDVSFTNEEGSEDITNNLLKINDFELFEINKDEYCFIYNIRSDYFSGFKLAHSKKDKFFNSGNKVFGILDNNLKKCGKLKTSKELITLEFNNDFQINHESENAIMLILDDANKTGKAMVINSQIIDSENYDDYLLTIGY